MSSMRAALLFIALATTPFEAHAQAGSGEITLGASGDLLFHTRVVEVANARGFDHLFGDLTTIATADEVAFANLETPLSLEREPSRGDPPRLGAPPAAARALAAAGLDVLSVANNHAWDQRATGMVETLATLREAGISPVGAAPEERDAAGPILLQRDGLRIAFLAYTVILQGHPGTRRPPVRISMWDEARARRAVRNARSEADLVVVSMHWGLGYRHADRSEQRDRARALVRWGADVILGHGPHVLQRVERVESPRGDALVAYSLGNLISNQGYRFRRDRRERDVQRPLREPATRDGVWLRIPLRVTDGRVSVGRVEGIPLWTENNWWDEERRRADTPNIQIRRLSQVEDTALRAERREAIMSALGEEVHLRED